MTARTTLCGLVLMAGAASGQTETEVQKLLPADYQINDAIGAAIAAQGDWLFVGAMSDGVTDGLQGTVRAYRWSGAAWAESQLIVASDAGYYHQFGRAVAMDGDTLIVGSADEPVIELNEEAMEHLTAPARLDIVPGATHLFEEPGALEEVSRLALEWFETHIGRTS